jgi:nucleotide-binding universal stress UspA family protein
MTEIVVGIDGSAASHRALEVAVHEARLRQADLRVVHSWHVTAYPVMPPGCGYEMAPLELEDRAVMAKTYVEQLLVTVPHDGVVIATDIQPGDAGQSLVHASKLGDLLIVGSRRHGTLASLLIGSAANYVLHHAHCPVMVVPAGTGPVQCRQVVVGVDGSDCGDAALRWAADRATAYGCPLVIVHAWQLITSPDWFGGLQVDREVYAEQIESWLAEHVAEVLPDRADLKVELRAVQDSTAGALTSAAGVHDLLVVGSRGRSGLAGLVLGSVAMQCVHHTKGAIAVLTPPRS